jgi:predicted enzyme related to lactoylglutathione lyase
VWFEPGLHLGVEQSFTPARKAHPAIAVDDLDLLAGRLREAGHQVAWDDRMPDRRRFHTSDPFGNRIELLAGD